MTRFGLLLTSNGFASQSLASALHFAKTSVQMGHSIGHIFLYQDAVYCASADNDLPADEPNLSAELAHFCQQHHIPLLFCITAAEKRGVPAAKLRGTLQNDILKEYVARGTYIFALPGSNGAVKDGWDGILAEQLDSRNRPCNFVELMPRLKEV